MTRRNARKVVAIRSESQSMVIENLSGMKYIKGNHLEGDRQQEMFNVFDALKEKELKNQKIEPEPVVGWLGWDEEEMEDAPDGAANPQAVDETLAKAQSDSIDWATALAPQGNETRLGDALRRWMHDSRNVPLAGIILITDGGLNAGVDAQAAIALARDERIKVFCIGMGSRDRPVNVALSDMIAPTRAYPGDSFEITGYVQADGLAGRSVTVELTSREARGAASQGGGRSEGIQRITLGANGQIVPIKFEVENTSSDDSPSLGRGRQPHAPG